MKSTIKQYYYFHDCETSGLTKQHSVLTYYGILLDENLNLIKETPEYKIVPNNSNSILVDFKAMEVNKINLIEHFNDPDRISYNLFINELGSFFNSIDLAIPEFKYGELYFSQKNNNWDKNVSNEINIVIGGHNVFLDNMFVYNDLKMELDPNIKIKDKRLLDTGSISQFLKFQGKLPVDLEISLGNLGKYFDLDVGSLHSAKKDTLLTIEVLKKMREM